MCSRGRRWRNKRRELNGRTKLFRLKFKRKNSIHRRHGSRQRTSISTCGDEKALNEFVRKVSLSQASPALGFSPKVFTELHGAIPYFSILDTTFRTCIPMKSYTKCLLVKRQWWEPYTTRLFAMFFFFSLRIHPVLSFNPLRPDFSLLVHFSYNNVYIPYKCVERKMLYTEKYVSFTLLPHSQEI